MMNAERIATFCEIAHQLQPQLAEYVATAPEQRSPEEDAGVRQLRLAVAGLFNIMVEVARMTPPPMPSMQARPPNPSVASTEPSGRLPQPPARKEDGRHGLSNEWDQAAGFH